MVSLVPGLGSRKFATQVVYLSLASLGLVAANSRLHASFTFYVRNPNLVRFFQKIFQKIFPKFFQYFFQKILLKFFPKLRHTASTMVSLVPGLASRKLATQVVYLSLASLGLVAANRGYMLLSLSMCVTLTLCVFSKIFFKNFFQNFSNIFFKNFCQNFFQNCDTRLLQWYLWSLGLVAANSRLRLCTCPLRLWAW